METKSSIKKEDFFSFTHWVVRNQWKSAEDSNGFYKKENEGTSFKTTEELFEIFLKEKSSRNIPS